MKHFDTDPTLVSRCYNRPTMETLSSQEVAGDTNSIHVRELHVHVIYVKEGVWPGDEATADVTPLRCGHITFHFCSTLPSIWGGGGIKWNENSRFYSDLINKNCLDSQ